MFRKKAAAAITVIMLLNMITAFAENIPSIESIGESIQYSLNEIAEQAETTDENINKTAEETADDSINEITVNQEEVSAEDINPEETINPEEAADGEVELFAASSTLNEKTFINEQYPDYMYFKSASSPFVSQDNVSAQVDTFTGSAQVSQTDLSLKGKNGLDFELTRFYSSSQAYYTDVSYETRGIVEKPTYNQTRLDIGVGWSFDFPSIETRKSKKFLHFGSKGTWELSVTYGSVKGFKDYDFNDMTINQNGSTYTLTLKGGTEYLFNSSGDLTQIKNRFGDTITFSYSRTLKNGLYTHSINVIDTVGRKIEIKQTATNSSSPEINGVDVTVISPIEPEKKIRYNILHNNTIDNCAQLVLTGVENVNDEYTDYIYEDRTMEWKKQGGDYLMDMDYCLLTDVIMPTGAASHFEYLTERIKIAEALSKDVFAVKESYDYDFNQYIITDEENEKPLKFNEKSYYYVTSYRLGSLVSGLHKYGIKNYNGNSISNIYKDAVCAVIQGDNDTKVMVYNAGGNINKEIVCQSVSGLSSDNANIRGVQTRISTTYQKLSSTSSTLACRRMLPQRRDIYTNKYNTETDEYDDSFIEVSESYTYDGKSGTKCYGDVLEYSYTDENSNKRTTQYVYLDKGESYASKNPYHIPIKKTYTQSSDKTVTEQYTLTEDKKNIESKEVYDFDGTTLREKTGYTYNADGTLQNSIVYNV